MNALMFPVFLGDFFYRLFTAENRAEYFWRGFGWVEEIDRLLSMDPVAPAASLLMESGSEPTA